MLILAINSASSKTGIALFEVVNSKVKTLAKNTWAAKNNEAEKLMPGIDALLKKKKKTYENLDQIYVVKGPGSFTGLRVGVTVANTIASLVDADLIGITTFDFLHSQTKLPILLFAGKGGVFLSKNATEKPELINMPDLNKVLSKKKIKKVSGDIIKDQIKVLQKVKFQKLTENFGSVMKEIIADNIKKKIYKSVKLVKPVYIKGPGITPKKKPIIIK
ncbi:MAG: tRNA (adenosine(37)-N6)-threonylcarbamoyltransferase complex dimerization subunit type 1 TsaB [Candidatus Peregrinibacteria bacterium]|nr:tRNA (adenosine(37)-N6)-threonylcarbamoyltransferase complex dimerization subunit type 1 TsaB [Candidatus Peregrinibacteria bacterium]